MSDIFKEVDEDIRREQVRKLWDRFGPALLVIAITPGSPAEAAGVIVGDILLEFDGKPTESPEDLLDLLIANRIGQPVPARTLRGGTARDVQITVAERTRG